MKNISYRPVLGALALTFALAFGFSASAQRAGNFEVLNDSDAEKMIPTNFYFAGQSAPTQMRNASVARIGRNRFVLAGLVDTSGYSTEISGKYEGFFITDSPVRLGNKLLGTGAYGFGFSKNGMINIFDLSSKQILSATTRNDADIKRPRPLMMTSNARGIRLYKGRSFVLIAPL